MSFNEDYIRDKELSDHLNAESISDREQTKQEALNFLSDVFPGLEEITEKVDYHFNDELVQNLVNAYQLLEKASDELKTL